MSDPADWRRPPEPPSTHWQFPSARHAGDDDLVAVGGDLEPGTLIAAYRAGLFPMPGGRKRLLWFSPEPRAIIPLDGLRVSRSLRRSRRRFEIRQDTAFHEVMVRCADPRRPAGWITTPFVRAYTRLHELGWAHSFECWSSEGELVGGLYGVRVDGLFAGESMFHAAPDASKVALVELVEWLRATGARLLDVQWLTPHLESLGAVAVPRDTYLDLLADALGTGGGPTTEVRIPR